MPLVIITMGPDGILCQSRNGVNANPFPSNYILIVSNYLFIINLLRSTVINDGLCQSKNVVITNPFPSNYILTLSI